jgi:TM2 domain-containing membrane protein YozV
MQPDDAEPTRILPPDDGPVRPPVPEPGPAALPATWYGPQPSGPPGYAPGYSGYQVPPPGYAPPPGYPLYDAYGRPLSDKSKIVAGVLGIALGGFGVGRFYTGHISMGVAQLVVTIFTCGLGHFWGLIDGVLILANGGTDAQGRILRD